MAAVPSLALHNNATQSLGPSTQQVTGWRNSSEERGTIEILWTCLTTIVACTWTILHLNLPGARDGAWTKFWRKLKWMVITIVFPEFTFAKAVCELQMAVEDLHQLSLLQDQFSYHVEYGSGCRLLHRLLTPRSSCYTQSRDPLPEIKNTSSRKLSWKVRSEPCELGEKYDSETWGAVYTAKVKRWTLTHCYFANMGGIVVAPTNGTGGLAHPWSLEAATAHCLSQCCLPSGCDHLKDSSLSKQEIDDRSNGDCLVKTFTTLQILWLVISVTTRTSCGLPISQLEICTVAFSIVAIATYLTNWAKPKDVACALAIVKINPSHAETCKGFIMRGQSCTNRLMKLAGPGQDGSSRILNDSFRMQDHGINFRTLSCALTFSTTIFGTIHCIAWRTEFPTGVEKVLWLVASILSTTLPLFSAALAAALGRVFRYETRKFWRYVQRDRDDIYGYSSRPLSSARYNLFWKDGQLWSSHSSALDPMLLSAIYDLELKLKDLIPQFDRGLLLDKSLDPALFQTVWAACQQAQQALSARGYMLTNAPIDTARFHPVLVGRNNHVQRTSISNYYWASVLCLLSEPSCSVQRAEQRWREIESWVSMVNCAFTCFSGIVYVVSRIGILILALLALREQDERVYVDTWAKLLPF